MRQNLVDEGMLVTGTNIPESFVKKP
jgi:hypothetical protein